MERHWGRTISDWRQRTLKDVKTTTFTVISRKSKTATLENDEWMATRQEQRVTMEMA